MNAVIFPKKLEGDIPDFVEVDFKKGKINFKIPEGMKCVGYKKVEAEPEAKVETRYIWWELYKGEVPKIKKGKMIASINKCQYDIPEDFTIASRGGNKYINGDLAFGFCLKKRK